MDSVMSAQGGNAARIFGLELPRLVVVLVIMYMYSNVYVYAHLCILYSIFICAYAIGLLVYCIVLNMALRARCTNKDQISD